MKESNKIPVAFIVGLCVGLILMAWASNRGPDTSYPEDYNPVLEGDCSYRGC